VEIKDALLSYIGEKDVSKKKKTSDEKLFQPLKINLRGICTGKRFSVSLSKTTKKLKDHGRGRAHLRESKSPSFRGMGST